MELRPTKVPQFQTLETMGKSAGTRRGSAHTHAHAVTRVLKLYLEENVACCIACSISNVCRCASPANVGNLAQSLRNVDDLQWFESGLVERRTDRLFACSLF